MHTLLTTCAGCRGEGTVQRERRRLPNGELDPFDSCYWPAVVCETCNGTGSVPIDANTIQEAHQKPT